MRDAELELSETEYAVLLLGFQGGATRKQAEPILQSMCRELTGLSKETVEAAACFFRCPYTPPPPPPHPTPPPTPPLLCPTLPPPNVANAWVQNL